MKFGSLSLAALASVAMLCMQMSGLHLHAGTSSNDAGLHAAHMHDVDPDEHDHSADIDVSLIDLGFVWSKILPVLLAVLPTILAIVWILHVLWPSPILVPFQRWRLRWRPPLRAPPLSP